MKLGYSPPEQVVRLMSFEERYSRQILFWGEDFQKVLKQVSVFVGGLGGLGCIVSELLARSGVGEIYLCDDGIVDLPDLNRQILYSEKDFGRKKAEVACEKLSEINSKVEFLILDEGVTEDLFMPNVDFTFDCLDNYKSRFLLYDLARPGCFFIHGGVDSNSGQIITLKKGVSKHLRDIYPNFSNFGKIPVTPDAPSVIGSFMVREFYNVVSNRPQFLDTFLIITFNDLKTERMEIG